MPNHRLLLATLLLTVTALPNGSGLANGPMGSDMNCLHQEYTKVSSLVEAGSVDFCISPPTLLLNSAATSYELVANANGPAVVTLGTVTFAFAVTDLSGCTVNAGTQTTTTGVFGSSSGIRYVVTLTANQCRGAITLVVQSGVVATTIFNQPLSFNAARTDNYQLNYSCENSGTTPEAFDPATNVCRIPSQRTYLCDATTFVDNVMPVGQCTHPQLWTYLCESKANDLDTTTCDTPNLRTYLCDATVSGTEPIPVSECTTPSLNVATSGSLRTYLCDATTSSTDPIPVSECTTPDLGIDHWPSLQTGGQSMMSGGVQFEGSPSVIKVPDINGPILVPVEYNVRVPPGYTTTTSIANTAPTFNAAGGAATCTSSSTTNQNQATIDGGINYGFRRVISFDADYCAWTSTVSLLNGAAVLAQVHFWHVITRDTLRTDIQGMNLTTGDVTVTIPMAMLLQLCGAGDVANGTCNPVDINANANVFANVSLERLIVVLIIAAIGAWLWAASQQIPVRILGIVTELFAGLYALEHRAELPGQHVLGLILLIIAAAFFLWLAITTLWALLRRRREAKEARAAQQDPINGDLP